MVKLILPIELTAEIEPHLPSDTKFVRVDSDGNFDSDPSDAEIYLNGFKLKPTTESPLWSLPNLFITPHTSAISPALKGRITNLFLDNLERYRGNKPLRNVVNKEAGY